MWHSDGRITHGYAQFSKRVRSLDVLVTIGTSVAEFGHDAACGRVSLVCGLRCFAALHVAGRVRRLMN